MSEASNHLFATYYTHQKKKIISNPTRIFVCIINSLLYNFSNFFTISPLLAMNGKICFAQLGFVTNKKELLKTFIYLFSHLFQFLFLLLSLTLSKIYPVMFNHSVIYKYAIISKLQLSLILDSFFLLADYLLVQLTHETTIKTEEIITKDCRHLISTKNLPKLFLNLFCIAQIVEFLDDNNTLLNKQLQQPIIN